MLWLHFDLSGDQKCVWRRGEGVYAFLKPYPGVPSSPHLPAVILITGHVTRKREEAQSKIPGLNQAFEVPGSRSQMRPSMGSAT